MKTCCNLHPFKSGLCRACWHEKKQNEYHCTWPKCIRPVFTLTLCRTHYRQVNVTCAWPDCHRPSYCKQVCARHYRKRQFPDIVQCSECSKPAYMNQKCFYHFTFRTCTECDRKVFSKQLCQRHYMQKYRSQRLKHNGPTINRETNADPAATVPETINQRPESHSSFEQSDIFC